MSSIQEIDPRLRDTSSPHLQPSQRPTGTTVQSHTTIAANPSSVSSTSISNQQYSHPIRDQTPLQGDTQSQLPYLSHTPRSAGNNTDHEDSPQDGGANDPKRSRACEACRGLKVKCEPDATQPDTLPCKRCKKAGRQCVVTQPSRKRQKKADSRIAELEKTVHRLQADLQAQSSGGMFHTTGDTSSQDGSRTSKPSNSYQQVTNGSYGQQAPPYAGPLPPSGVDWSPYAKATHSEGKNKGAPMVVAGQKRKHSGNRDASAMHSNQQARTATDDLIEQVGVAWSSVNPDTKAPQTHEYADVIDRGVLTMEVASQIFTCYVEKMAPHIPAVVFAPGTPASKVRRETPILFLAVLAAASGMNYPDLQRPLTKEITAVFADRIVIRGDKSLELVQALQVSTLWYWPPEHFEELKFYQLIHITAVMALDIGMGVGKPNKPTKLKSIGLFRDNPWRKQPHPDPTSIEARRAWLTCYFLCCNTSMGLRRPNLIRWSPFMDDCVKVLETSPDAAASDKVLTQWVRSQKIAEEIGSTFLMDDPTAKVSISDTNTQFHLKGFERELEKWKAQIPEEARSRTLELTEHVVNLYMHEIAMHVDHNVDQFKPPYSEETLRGLADGTSDDALTPHHIAALSACLTSIDGVFESFLGFDVETVRCLPVANFVRVAYAVVVLIKMYFAASTPTSSIGKVFDKDNMKVEYYLNRLVSLFSAASAENKSRPSSKFLMVLVMLKTWFHRQKAAKSPPENQSKDKDIASASNYDAGSAGKAETDRERSEHQQRQMHGYGPTNTPLQLLSQVATNDSRVTARSDNQYAGSMPDWQHAQQPQPFQNYANVNQMQPDSYPVNNIDPNLGPADLNVDFNSIGEGFEQAIGFIAPWWSEDYVFSGMMGAPGFDGF